MFGPVSAVAIDDEPSHLLAITAGMSASGIASMGFWFDRDKHELVPPPPEGGLKYLRIIFMDLNLAQLGGNPEPATLAGTVISVLKQVLARDAGPYLLIFWTQVSGLTEAVSKLLYERLEGIPLPLAIEAIPKGNFIPTTPKQNGFNDGLRELFSALSKTTTELRSAVLKAVNSNPQLSVLAHWEARAADAATRTVNELHACAVEDIAGKTSASDSVERVLAQIAIAAAGPVPAIRLPARALDAGLLDILVDQFGTSVDGTEYVTVVEKAIKATVKAADEPPSRPGVKFNRPALVAAELNALFHIDKEVSTAKTSDRGVVLPAKPPLNAGKLGFDPADYFTGEFLHPDQVYLEAERATVLEQLQKFRAAAEFVLVEVGADCDHAQNSHRTRRYLLGLEIPEEYLSLAKSPRDGQLRNGSLQLMGPWAIDGQIRYLIVSCRRFWAHQQPNPPPSAGIKYRLRAALVNKLLHHYSVWHSRPGIVEFRA